MYEDIWVNINLQWHVSRAGLLGITCTYTTKYMAKVPLNVDPLGNKSHTY